MILARIRGKSALKYFVDIIGQAIREEKFSMNKEVPEVEKGKQVWFWFVTEVTEKCRRAPFKAGARSIPFTKSLL